MSVSSSSYPSQGEPPEAPITEADETTPSAVQRVGASEHLIAFTAAPEYRNPLDAFPVGQKEGFSHIVFRCLLREINGFRHRVVRMALECGLHANMPFRGDVEGRYEQEFRVVRHFLHSLDGFTSHDPH